MLLNETQTNDLPVQTVPLCLSTKKRKIFSEFQTINKNNIEIDPNPNKMTLAKNSIKITEKLDDRKRCVDDECRKKEATSDWSALANKSGILENQKKIEARIKMSPGIGHFLPGIDLAADLHSPPAMAMSETFTGKVNFVG